MNAEKIIEEIARLPEEEQGKVVDFVEHLKAQKKSVRYMDKDKFEATAKAVFDKNAKLFEKLAQ